MDEATSALDTESERRIQEALEGLRRGRTMIVVTHRLSTLENVDYVGVVNNGQIAEFDKRSELLRRKGEFARLMKLQSFH